MRLACFVVLAPLAACGPDDSTGACKDSLLPGDLVITEVFADYAAPAGGAGTDDGKEWFEVFNNTDRPVSLKGITIVHSRPDGSRSNQHNMADVTIAPGQYFTLGNATQDLVPPYVDYGYGNGLGDMFNTGGGKLALRCGSSEIDSAAYDSVRAGRSRQLTSASPPDYTLNDDPNNWCEARSSEFEPNNFGTPGQESDCAPIVAGACSDEGVMRQVVSPGIGEIVITEVMPRPSSASATTGQWFEVMALADVDLNGVGLDRANDNSAPTVLQSASCIHLAAGEYGLFARSADTTMNGGLTVLGTFSFSINPTTAVPDLQLLLGSTVIDAVTWTTPTNGRSRSLDPDSMTSTANDDHGSWCDSQTIYNGNDRGTPGAANEQCPAQPVPGQCLDNGVLRAIVKPTGNNLVITEFLANPAGTVAGVDGREEWFEIKNIGTTAFDLNELNMQFGTSTVDHPIQAATCRSVPPNGYALFAHQTDPGINGGLPAVDVTFTPQLGNTSGGIRILDGANLLDAVAWTTAASAPDGRSRQLQPNMTTTTANDDVNNFCSAPMVPGQLYGTSANYGTPKAVNACN